MSREQVENVLELFGVQQLNEIQQKLSRITKLGFVTVNYRGEPLTDFTGFCRFCSRFRNHPELSKNCIASDAASSIQSAISEKPLIYMCPGGLTEIAIPIVVNNVYLGGFLCGQALCSDPPEDILHMRPATDPVPFSEALTQAEPDKNGLPVFDYQHFQDIAELVNMVVTLLCENKFRQLEQERDLRLQIRRNTLLDSQIQIFSSLLHGNDYDRYLRAVSGLCDGMDAENITEAEDRRAFLLSFVGRLAQFSGLMQAENWQQLYPIQGRDLESRRAVELWLTRVLDYLYRQASLSSSPMLETVFQYINQHVTDILTLSILVEQCGISQSYLSRLFRSRFGITVTDYIHKRKILRAKQELLHTGRSIGEIALDVGYNEYTYFSKVFRKYENMGVREYRNTSDH